MNREQGTTETHGNFHVLPSSLTIAAICSIGLFGTGNALEYSRGISSPNTTIKPSWVPVPIYQIQNNMTVSSIVNAPIEMSGPLVANYDSGIEDFIASSLDYISKSALLPGDDEADKVVDDYYSRIPLKIKQLAPPRKSF
jgi:hypothetical protein